MPWRNPATATEGTLWGRVVNGTTGQPVEFATVQAGAQPSVETDSNGYYVLTMLPAAAAGTNYSVTASGGGCPQVNLSNVAVFAGSIARRDITLCPSGPRPGDMDLDGDVDFSDLGSFVFCMQGPDIDYATGQFCLRGDLNADFDVDLADFSAMQGAAGTAP
jgi:hypothetical protein